MEPRLYKECLSWLSGTIRKLGKIINTGNATAASNITVTATVRFHVWKIFLQHPKQNQVLSHCWLGVRKSIWPVKI